MLSTLHTLLGENLQSLLWKQESLGLKMVRLTWYHICQKHPLTQKDTADIVSKEVAAGGAVTLPGLGKFQCRARPERMVRNPATGEQFMKAADRVAKVTIAKALKDVIND